MNEYRNEVNKYAKESPWTIFSALWKVILPLMLVGLVISVVSSVFSVATQPVKVLQKTMDADNVIHKYEWFHDVYTQQEARVNQVTQFKGFLRDESDSSEKQRLRMEMAAQQMSCRDLVAKYNANSEKINVSIFKGWSLPDRLNTNECE